MKRSQLALMLLVLYGLSGLTALAYEVLWTRMLSLLFGISILGVVVTVAAFMLGLGLGSLMGCRWQVLFVRSLRLLACIEIGVALYALLLPLVMPLLQGLWLSVEHITVWQFWQMACALLVLCLPAMALGLAFPLMIRVGKAAGLSLGALYGVNTLGGAAGALLPLLLLPVAGWMFALQSVAALGALLAVLLLWLSFQVQRKGSESFESLHAASTAEPLASAAMASHADIRYTHLWAYAGLGAGALMLEIAWTRAYGMILLRTEYVLAVILSVFLVGIGLGSMVAKYLPRSQALRMMPLLVAVMAIAGLYAFPYINAWGQDVVFESLLAALLYQGFLIALCTLPVTLLFGAWLPLIAQDFHADAGAKLYAANSIGACLGALLAGFVLIPWIGTAATWLLATLLIMMCGWYWLAASRRVLMLSVSMIVFVVLTWPVKQLPPASLLLQAELPAATDLYQAEDAVSISHVLERDDGQRILLADLQRMDASSDPTSVAVQRNQARLPLFLHANPESVLFLGLGTGITASGALAWPGTKLTAVELSKGAIVASRTYFGQVNGNIADKMTIEHDDARRFLMRSDDQFDVIVGDLFHPDMVGRGALLSVEQFARAKLRLHADGVFVQWLAVNQFDALSLQVVLRSFAQVFSQNAVFVDGYRLGLIGFHDHHHSAAEMIAAAPDDALWGGEGGWTWLGRYWGSVTDLLAGSTAVGVQGEWSPMIEFSLPALRYQRNALSEVLVWLVDHRIDIQSAAQRWSISREEMLAFKRAWAATAFNVRGQLMMLQSKPGVQRLQSLAYRANPNDRWAGFGVADAMFASLEHALPEGLNYEQALQRVLLIRPDHEAALKAMITLLHQRGDEKSVQYYMDRLFHVSPYARVS